MRLGELKKSTLYQSSDLDEMEIYMSITRNGKQQLEPLCYLGVEMNSSQGVIIVGGLSDIQYSVECGAMKPPKGYVKPLPDELPFVERETHRMNKNQVATVNDVDRHYEIEARGWKDYWDGRKQTDCPTYPSIDDRDAWMEGWLRAQSADLL